MDEVKDPVLSNDVRQLEEEHRRYSQQLEELLQIPYPTHDQMLEEAHLKRLKLRIKDRIAELQREHSLVA